MVFYREMEETKNSLEKLGHKVLTPPLWRGDFHKLRDKDESEWFRLKPQLIKEHFDKIKDSDAILVLNYDKNSAKNYIGGNTLLELAIAFDCGKKIFLLNPIPMDLPYAEEIEVIKPVVINGELEKIR
jgi:hypothetical protein